MSVPYRLACGLAAVALLAAAPAPVPQVETVPDLADLALTAPTVVRATIAKIQRLSGDAAAGVAPGRTRMLVEANIVGVLVAPSAVPARIRYLWDAPLDARGKAPKVKNAPVLLFLRGVPGRDSQYQLARPGGQIAWTETAEATTRRLLTEARTPEMAGMWITGVSGAFHVEGSVPGEAESQIFLSTNTGKPVSIVVLTRRGQPKSYAVALGDLIDESARPAAPGSLLWYQMACRLPRALPDEGVSIEAADRAAVAADYRFVLDQLGPCTRTISG